MKIAYQRPDGGITIVYGVPKASVERVVGELTDEQYRELVLGRSVPSDATDVEVLPDDWAPPEDRTFRDAWVKRKGGIDIDMTKARDVHRKHLRKARSSQLADLDIAALRALEAQDVTTAGEITARKQKLRDAPAHPAIEAAKTPDELKSLTLDVLTR